MDMCKDHSGAVASLKDLTNITFSQCGSSLAVLLFIGVCGSQLKQRDGFLIMHCGKMSLYGSFLQ